METGRNQAASPDNPRVAYFLRKDATPESELLALAAVFKFVIQAHERKIAVAPENEIGKEVISEGRQQRQDQ
jgi:hypothetical protein